MYICLEHEMKKKIVEIPCLISLLNFEIKTFDSIKFDASYVRIFDVKISETYMVVRQYELANSK